MDLSSAQCGHVVEVLWRTVLIMQALVKTCCREVELEQIPAILGRICGGQDVAQWLESTESLRKLEEVENSGRYPRDFTLLDPPSIHVLSPNNITSIYEERPLTLCCRESIFAAWLLP